MYFIALVAPQEIDGAILKWKQFMKEQFGCVVALRSPAHITLIPPFWGDEILEKKLQDAIGTFSQKQIPFKINLKDFAAFRPRVIYVDVLPDQSLQVLHLQLKKFLTGSNLFPIQDEHPFHPHVTIATRDLHKKAFYEAWKIFKKENYKASCRIKEISLLKHNQKNWDVLFTSQFPN